MKKINVDKPEYVFQGVWISKEIWLSKDLTWMEKLFLTEITNLDGKNGCYASNKYFSTLFQLSTHRCSQIINSLVAKEFITSEIQRKGKIITKRVLHVVKCSKNTAVGVDKNVNTPMDKNVNTPMDKNVKENSISSLENTTNNIERGGNPLFPPSSTPSKTTNTKKVRYKSNKVMKIIKDDEDWKFAYSILIKFFPKELVNPKLLKYKDMMTLQELMMDTTFDFEKYCKWYYEVKYSSKSFTWGLFMYPAVVGEFRAQYKGNSVYLKTTSNLKNNEVFQKDVEDTKKWIVDVLKKAKAKKR